jgi:hypothetical protein
VRALAFDVFGTLVEWRSGISEALRATAIDADPAKFADDWRARYRPILAEVNEGSREWATSTTFTSSRSTICSPSGVCRPLSTSAKAWWRPGTAWIHDVTGHRRRSGGDALAPELLVHVPSDLDLPDALEVQRPDPAVTGKPRLRAQLDEPGAVSALSIERAVSVDPG